MVPRRVVVERKAARSKLTNELPSSSADDRIFAPQGRRLEKLLSEMGIEHDVKIYDGAGHSFMSHNSGVLASIGKISPMHAGYDPKAADDSWKRIEMFFARHLGK